jgi:hypothetical protein
MSAPAPAEANLHKDEVTGEMVSKSYVLSRTNGVAGGYGEVLV